jgi:HSP20 family molecular chaperone IbpA
MNPENRTHPGTDEDRILRMRLLPIPDSQEPPLVDVEETPSHYLLTLDVRRMLGNEITIELSDELLLLRSILRDSEPSLKRVSLRVDSGHHSLAAHYRNGQLRIALPKFHSNGKCRLISG